MCERVTEGAKMAAGEVVGWADVHLESAYALSVNNVLDGEA